MTPSRGISRARLFRVRNLARVVVAGIVVIGTPLVLSGTANAAPDGVWDQIAKCESGGKWNTSTGNGFSGGLQFTPSTWRAYGGKGNAASASREEQIRVAERVLAGQGWGAWPVCSKKAGAKGGATARTVTSSSGRTSAVKTARTEVKHFQPAMKPTHTEVKPTHTVATPIVSLTKAGADYTAVQGDSLDKIAHERKVAGGWHALFDRNRDVLSDPNVLQIGQQLDLG
jgi:hypothetical protein